MYSGTDVKLVFLNNKQKEATITLLSIQKTRKIELLMQETKAVMGIVF